MNQTTGKVSQDFSQLISALFDSANSKIQPIDLSNNTSAKDEISKLIQKMESCKDWDEQLSVIQHGISLVKGNSCEFTGFVSQLPNFVAEIMICISDPSTTLVKYTCLYLIELFKKLQDQCDPFIEKVISALFEAATSEKQIISSSCKFTILEIINYVKTKSTLNEILKQASTQSLVPKVISSECIQRIMMGWTRTNLLIYFKQLEKVIFDQLSDSSVVINENAKCSAMQMIKLFPNRSTILPPVLDSLNGKPIQGKGKVSTLPNNDYSNTISFTYSFQEKNQPVGQNSEENNKQDPNDQENPEKSYLSNIPRKKRTAYNLEEYKLKTLNLNDESKTMTFLYDPKTKLKPSEERSRQNQTEENQPKKTIFETNTNAKRSNISNNSKPSDAAETMLFSFDVDPKQKSSFYSKERSKNNANLSVHFHKTLGDDIKSTNNKAAKNSDSKAAIDIKVEGSNNAKMSLLSESLIEEEQCKDDNDLEIEADIETQKETKAVDSDIFTTILQKSPKSTHFNCVDNKENDFLDLIRTTIATKQTIYISQNADSIVEGIIHCIQSQKSSIEISGLNLFVHIIKIIPNAFEDHLQKLVAILLKKADQSQSSTAINATNALRTISTLYPPEAILHIGIQCTESNALCSFIANLVRLDESILLNDEIASKLLPICCKIYETTTEQRISALAVGLLNKLHESNPKMFAIFASSVDDQWSKLLKSLYLEPRIPESSVNLKTATDSMDKKQEPSRILASITKYRARNSGPEAKLENILSQLSSEKLKFSILNSLIDFFKETNGEIFLSSIPYLVKLINSSYYEQIKECISILSNTNRDVNKSLFLNSMIDYLVNDPSVKAIDCLSEVIRFYKSRDLSPRIQEILSKIKVFLEDESAIARKSAVRLIVQLRLSIGKVFDGEINKISSIHQKLVKYYLAKEQCSPTSS